MPGENLTIQWTILNKGSTNATFHMSQGLKITVFNETGKLMWAYPFYYFYNLIGIDIIVLQPRAVIGNLITVKAGDSSTNHAVWNMKRVVPACFAEGGEYKGDVKGAGLHCLPYDAGVVPPGDYTVNVSGMVEVLSQELFSVKFRINSTGGIANSAETKKESVFYVHIISRSGSVNVSGLAVRLVPLEADRTGCGFGLPYGARLLEDELGYIFPNGTKIIFLHCPDLYYLTNETGWVGVHPSVSSRYYSVFVIWACYAPRSCNERADFIAIDPNQTQVVTLSTARLGNQWEAPIITTSEGGKSKVWGTTLYSGFRINNSRWIPPSITVKLGENKSIAMQLDIFSYDSYTHHYKLALPDYSVPARFLNSCSVPMHPCAEYCKDGQLLPHPRGAYVYTGSCFETFIIDRPGKFPILLDPRPDEKIDEKLATHPEEIGWLIVEP